MGLRASPVGLDRVRPMNRLAHALEVNKRLKPVFRGTRGTMNPKPCKNAAWRGSPPWKFRGTRSPFWGTAEAWKSARPVRGTRFPGFCPAGNPQNQQGRALGAAVPRVPRESSHSPAVAANSAASRAAQGFPPFFKDPAAGRAGNRARRQPNTPKAHHEQHTTPSRRPVS